MLIKVIRDYYDYSEWANNRVLDAAEGLTDEQFLESTLPGIWSMRDTLAHIMISQWAWVERWSSRPVAIYPSTTEFADVASIRAFWSSTYNGMQDVLARLNDRQLADDFPYTNAKGEHWSYPLWEEFIQVANHSTYHRGEVAALLTSLGHSPGELDWLIWRDGQQSSD